MPVGDRDSRARTHPKSASGRRAGRLSPQPPGARNLRTVPRLFRGRPQVSRRERLYHLHDILRQRRTPISRQDLMAELGCSQATLYRLIAELRDHLGAPLEQDPDGRGLYYDRSLAGSFELPGLWISPEELQA